VTRTFRPNGEHELFNPNTVNAASMLDPPKRPKKKLCTSTVTPTLTVERDPFSVFAVKFLSEDGLLGEIKKGREAFLKSGFPLLRAQLAGNTMDRIRLAMFNTLGSRFAGAISKAVLIERSLGVFEELFGVNDKVAPFVADFGLARETVEDSVITGEVVLLHHNSVDSRGGPCVEEMGLMTGWVKRDNTFVAVIVDSENIDWSKLYLHKPVTLKG
jgi:hypothetical protein